MQGCTSFQYSWCKSGNKHSSMQGCTPFQYSWCKSGNTHSSMQGCTPFQYSWCKSGNTDKTYFLVKEMKIWSLSENRVGNGSLSATQIAYNFSKDSVPYVSSPHLESTTIDFCIAAEEHFHLRASGVHRLRRVSSINSSVPCAHLESTAIDFCIAAEE